MSFEVSNLKSYTALNNVRGGMSTVMQNLQSVGDPNAHSREVILKSSEIDYPELEVRRRANEYVRNAFLNKNGYAKGFKEIHTLYEKAGQVLNISGNHDFPLLQQLQHFVKAWRTLDIDRNDPNIKKTVVAALKDVFHSLQGTNRSLNMLRHNTQSTLSSSLEHVNTLLKKVATFNKDIIVAKAENRDIHPLQDILDKTLTEVSDYVQFNVIKNHNGSVALLGHNGETLVNNTDARQFHFSPVNAALGSTHLQGSSVATGGTLQLSAGNQTTTLTLNPGDTIDSVLNQINASSDFNASLDKDGRMRITSLAGPITLTESAPGVATQFGLTTGTSSDTLNALYSEGGRKTLNNLFSNGKLKALFDFQRDDLNAMKARTNDGVGVIARVQGQLNAIARTFLDPAFITQATGEVPPSPPTASWYASHALAVIPSAHPSAPIDPSTLSVDDLAVNPAIENNPDLIQEHRVSDVIRYLEGQHTYLTAEGISTEAKTLDEFTKSISINISDGYDRSEQTFKTQKSMVDSYRLKVLGDTGIDTHDNIATLQRLENHSFTLAKALKMTNEADKAYLQSI